MGPTRIAALPSTSAHTHRCSFTKRTSQDALIPTMGNPSTIPVLQMVITLLALSECLPISTGGRTPAAHRQYPHSNVLPSLLADKHTKAVIQNMEKLWIEKFQKSDYFKQLPDTLQEDVKEFLNSRTRNILGGDQSWNTQEHVLRKPLPSSSIGNMKSVIDSTKSSGIKTIVGKQSSPGDMSKLDKSKSDNVTVVMVSGKTDHRSKRSYGRMRHFNNRISPYLSNGPIDITYTHVVPCVYADRYYCLNGGTCVFVGALDLKTCR